ncbi:hypothetical protein EW146_g10054 [Bondarzewia mesenterica]|uniref:Uncharacterized protein n=1 Tax=Bondarzewia mesenterica TaxID=1095465 RepID=A0A4S4L2Q3_9AGAM|nr:hypothetical protein EW146_g10054 [Bondarzewia mesenterica]
MPTPVFSSIALSRTLSQCSSHPGFPHVQFPHAVVYCTLVPYSAHPRPIPPLSHRIPPYSPIAPFPSPSPPPLFAALTSTLRSEAALGGPTHPRSSPRPGVFPLSGPESIGAFAHSAYTLYTSIATPPFWEEVSLTLRVGDQRKVP